MSARHVNPRVEALRVVTDELIASIADLEAECSRLSRENARLVAENNAMCDELHATRELRDAAEEAVGELQEMNERAQAAVMP